MLNAKTIYGLYNRTPVVKDCIYSKKFTQLISNVTLVFFTLWLAEKITYKSKLCILFVLSNYKTNIKNSNITS
ncbi:hypothetical protein C0J52_16096 [Blattella germanica]|nr:hypothetical protein C0J52_16096 [Blattella germanica]